MGSTVRGSNAGGGRWVFFFSKTPRPALWPAQLHIQYVPGFFWGVNLTTQFHRVQKLGMSGAIPLLPLYAFMACAGAAVYFNLYFLNCARTALWFNQVIGIVGFVVDSDRRDPSNPHLPNS